MPDRQDKTDALLILAGITLAGIVCMLAFAFVLPVAKDIIQNQIQPGLNLQNSAIISFFISLTILLVMAVFSGDGLIGELQFMIPAFLLFYFIIWIQLAWIF